MNGTTQSKREQADAVVGSAFEAHLAESRWPKLADRRVDALVKVEGEVTALAYEKGLNPRTLRSAFYRLQDRVLDSGSFAKTTAGHVGAVAPQPEPSRDDRYDHTHPRHRELMLPCYPACQEVR